MDANAYAAGYCEHDECRCTMIEELLILGGMSGRSFTAESVLVLSSLVRCRHVPRKGMHGTAVAAPLP